MGDFSDPIPDWHTRCFFSEIVDLKLHLKYGWEKIAESVLGCLGGFS